MARRKDGVRRGKRKEKRNSQETHGLHAARRMLAEYGSRAIDRRTNVGKGLMAWRAAIAEDLGGEENISAQRLALLDLAVKTKLLLDGIDMWLLTQDSLIDEKKRKVVDVVRERMRLSDSLAKYLQTLGLERKRPPLQDLGRYIETNYGDGAPADNGETDDAGDDR